MLSTVVTGNALLAADMPGWLYNTLMFIKVLIGFSVIIFVHELGHFLAAKWAGVRVDRFAIGFGTRLFGWRGGEGFTLGNRPDYSADELREKKYAETDYCFKVLPIGGYVKMLGQDDVIVNEETGEMSLSDDPRAFTNRPVGQRMVVVSAGVIFNILFAALLLMCVFLIGKEATAPVVGMVQSDSPARGLLFPGDRILEVDGSKVRSFDELRSRIALSGSSVQLKIERGGKVLSEPLDIDTMLMPNMNIPMLSIDPLTTLELERDVEADGEESVGLRAGDVVIAIDGNAVQTPSDVWDAFQRSHGRALEVQVKRPKAGKPGEFDTVTCPYRAPLSLDPADFPKESDGSVLDNRHLLGLRPRRGVDLVLPGRPAEKAGFQKGDIIVAWGTLLNPNYTEIRDSIRSNADQQTHVVVLRGDNEVDLEVTPKRPFKLFGEPAAEVGISFASADFAHPIVADVAPDTPFSEVNMPRGAEITSLDGRPVATWYDLAEILLSVPGRTIEVRYRAGKDETVGQVRIPSSVVDQLNLPLGAFVWAVDGEKSFTVPGSNGRKVRMQIVGSSPGLRAILKDKIGKTVAIRYSAKMDGEPAEATFQVTEANFDPWQLRVRYAFDITAFKPMKDLVTAHGNPLVAMGMGVDHVCDLVRQMYLFMTRLADRSIGTENVAGPVGIISIAVQRAKAGTAELLLFLAFLSVNLAVINFLPMPVMDGGLMVFLLIEKIKGKPLGLKAQMISTMVGLGAIIIIGLYVTIQDIGRFF